MKIIDITEGLKWKPSTETFRDIVNRMGKISPVRGAGIYSEVFQHPDRSDVVVKVFKEDRGYARYFSWMTQHQNNRYVPKIIENEEGELIKLFRNRFRVSGGSILSHRVGIVYLQRLTPMTEKQLDDLNDYLISYMNDDTKQETSKRNVFLGKDLTAGLSVHAWADISKNSRDRDPDLSEITEYFVRLYVKYGPLDIHDGNIMWDSTRNNPVFIDVLNLD